MQRGPLEEAGRVQQQADDDHGHEGARGVPHDMPDDGNVAPVDHAGQQGDTGADDGAPADAQAARLPDDED
ncbi:hypothetical protein D3C72_2322010 [compost metagenome]